MNIPFLNIQKQFIEINDEIINDWKNILDECCFIGGKYVDKLEHEMSQYIGCKHVISCANGTDALVLALKACGVKPGDEVITTSFSFFATAETISSIGAIPVFVDINENDYNINTKLIEREITEKTKAILPVHIFGAPCDMDSIMNISKKYNIKVICDCAQAIGSKYKNIDVGNLGDVSCFSFYPTKNLGCAGDGGMVTTNDEKIYTFLRALKSHGAGEDGANAYKYLNKEPIDLYINDQKVTDLYNPYKYYNFLIGYNSRLDALQAAVLSIKLKHLNDYNKKRENIAKRYDEGINSCVLKPNYFVDVTPCYHQYVIRSKYKYELIDFLSKKNIGCGAFYPIPLHKQKAFNAFNSKNSSKVLPIVENVCRETVCLPIYPEMDIRDVDYVIDSINKFYEEKV